MIFKNYREYVNAVLASMPDEYPEGFGYYQAGAWLKQKKFKIKNELSLPKKSGKMITYLDRMDFEFWKGYNS